MATSNVVTLVDELVEASQQDRETPLAPDVAFELFAASSMLRQDQVSDDEISAGRIGGGQDGAIDAVYTFVDGELLDEDSPYLEKKTARERGRKGAVLSLRLIQAKRETSFTETAFDKVTASTSRLLQIETSEDELRDLYSQDVIDRLRIFTRAWEALSILMPKVEVEFCYVTRGDTERVAPAVEQKRKDLEDHLRSTVTGSTAKATLVGAKELWELASATPEYDLQLKLHDAVTKGDSHAGLVHLSEYYKFLTDDSGELRGHLFDSNVRDYQGAVTVNKEIQDTLRAASNDDFWWLNNGVTILCTEAIMGGNKTFTLSGVQIVNGMQTSHTIYETLQESEGIRERNAERSLHVRIIKANNAETRDKIIRATNSQTKIPPASLHATEEIHRQVESYFLRKGWYYDRRKNYYKNIGKPSERIISIQSLGQAVMAIGLSRPDSARARPSTLLNNDTDYASVFNPELPLPIFLWIAQVQRRVDSMLTADVDTYTRTNTRFYVSMYIVTRKLGTRVHSPQQLAQLAETPPEVSSTELWGALNDIDAKIREIQEETDWLPDRIAKSPELKEAVIRRALERTHVES